MTRIIAFAFAEINDRLSPLYRGLAEDLCKNIRQVMPNMEILHITDRLTPFVDGAHIFMRTDRDVGLMTWHMMAHEAAHLMYDEVLFTEPDVRFRENVLHIFDDKDFEICVTEREVDAVWTINGERVMLSDVAPYTLGTTFSRSRQFWKDVTRHCKTLGEREQNWIGDMISLWAVIQRGTYRVKIIDGPTYNHIPCSREDTCDVKVLHYKGMRKEWLLPGVREVV